MATLRLQSTKNGGKWKYFIRPPLKIRFNFSIFACCDFLYRESVFWLFLAKKGMFLTVTAVFLPFHAITGATLPSRRNSCLKRIMLYTRFIMPILTCARSRPIVRTMCPPICACAPNTCSTRARTFDFSRFACPSRIRLRICQKFSPPIPQLCEHAQKIERIFPHLRQSARVNPPIGLPAQA